MTLWRGQLAYWVRMLPVRVLGVALVMAAGRPWATVHGAPWAVLFGGVVVFAVWAAPGLDQRPSLDSARWSYGWARHRTTVLACASVALAALGDPPVWQACCAAVLLVGYLVASDAWSTGPTTQRSVSRVWGEGAGAVVGAGLVLGASAVPDVGAGGAGRVLAAVVLAVGVLGGGLGVRRFVRAGGVGVG
jgi:hypothetical protein